MSALAICLNFAGCIAFAGWAGRSYSRREFGWMGMEVAVAAMNLAIFTVGATR